MRALLAAVLIGLTDLAAADGIKSGWMAQFQQYTSSGDPFPVGYAQDFQKSGLSYVCNGGAPTFAFYPKGFGSEQEVTVDFKGARGAKTFHFRTRDVPQLGGARVIIPEDAVALKAIFLEASPADVPFRQEEAFGVFPSVGAKKVFDVIETAC